jgi:hypothetical protein
MKTFTDISLDFFKHIKADSELRLGQQVFNYFHDVEPDIVNQITGTDKDCFYLSNKIGDFLEEFAKLYNQKYNL